MSYRLTIASLSLAWLMTGCAGLMPGKSSKSTAGYHEDLSAWRPELPAVEAPADTLALQPADLPDSLYQEVGGRLNYLLDTVAAFSRQANRYIEGYSIQIFTGDSRAEARERMMDFLRSFPDSEPKLTFEQPNYKVRIGRYYSRLEAYAFYREVRRVFPKAILVPVRIYL